MFKSLAKGAASFRTKTLLSRSRQIIIPIRRFASQDATQDLLYEDLEQKARDIQASIDTAKQNIAKHQQRGKSIVQQITQEMDPEKYVKMQRYDIFISKMEQLARAEKRWKQEEKRAVMQMQNIFVNSAQPIKDILYHYNRASDKGFNASLMANTLEQLKMALHGRGNQPRPYYDYNLREFDSSWRMQVLSGHYKTALTDELYFNHYFLGQASRQLGDIGFKDVDIIERTFKKVDSMLTERETGRKALREPLTYSKGVYGTYKNLVPHHYVYDGFETNQEFEEHLKTLLDWEAEEANVFEAMGIEADENIEELEESMGKLIKAASNLKDLQLDMQGSLENLRQQYFKLQQAFDKHEFMEDNKYIRLELLELQDQMVRAGYIDPDEALKLRDQQPWDVRMDRASQIFYEYIQNYAPELVSPQHQPFIQASEAAKSLRTMQKEAFNLSEPNDKISFGSLSSILVGLERQALSYRREARDRDYLNEYYKNLLNEGEFKPFENAAEEKTSSADDYAYVRMERDYLKAWVTYQKGVDSIKERMLKLGEQSLDSAEDMLFGFRGLSAAKLEAPELREKMYDSLLNGVLNESEPRVEALIDGLMGIALQARHSSKAMRTAKQILKKFKPYMSELTSLDFDKKSELLWGICALGLETGTPITKILFLDINHQRWETTQNDLSYHQQNLIGDYQLYLTQVSHLKNSGWLKSNINESLDIIARNQQFHALRYPEARANFDPFKKRVIQGVASGLATANIDHEVNTIDNLIGQTNLDTTLNEENYPYKPDINFGYKGQKVMLSVVPSSRSMSDVGLPNGEFGFQSKILKGLADKPVQAVGVPVSAILDLDIENMKLDINRKFDFIQCIKSQLDSVQPEWRHQIDINGLSDFGASFTRALLPRLNSELVSTSDKRRLKGFFDQLFRVFQLKKQVDKQFEKVVYQQGLDKLKFELLKMSLMFQALPKGQRDLVGGFVPKQYSSFEDMINYTKGQLQMRLSPGTYDEIKEKSLNTAWIGVRQEVELPASHEFKLKKKIEPELLNQKFMWVDDYFHYEDWEQQMKETYDSFNLLVVPRQEGDFKYFYDRSNNQRIVPQGIFPTPNSKREILEPQISQFAMKKLENRENGVGMVDQFTEEPFKLMINQELTRAKQLKPLTNTMSYITNLQNMKQGLKKDFSDKELLTTLLVNTKFTDALIEEHLNKLTRRHNIAPDSTEFLQRDPSKFREFVKSTYFSKDQEDPFTHFYIKESAKQERMFKLYKEVQEERADEYATMGPDAAKKVDEHILKTVEDKIDEMMLQNQRENEDITSVSHQFESEVKINYNLKSLMKSEFVYDVDPLLTDPEISDPAFLDQFRRRAETKLIKSRILFKQHEGIELSDSETKYLKMWIREIEKNPNTTILNVRDTMIPPSHSVMSLSQIMTPDDIYALNQISGVQLDSSMHGNFSVNDMIVEMSHFLDEEVVNRVETDLITDRVRKEWSLPQDFQILETRNKEISLTINELEELAWRMAGMFDERDQATIKEMFSIQRNQDYFDKQFYENDSKSMDQFMTEANGYDDRNSLLEEWVVRKEEEIKKRLVIPPKHLRKPDYEIYQRIDKQVKQARENLVTKFLDSDKHGNSQAEKPYKDITSEELGRITESLCVRLNLFEGTYPAFLPQAVKAVMEHPNLRSSDYDQLNTYCRMFELDWKGDQSLNNKQRFMATNPVYLSPEDRSNFLGYGTIGEFEVAAMLRHACTPFVGELAKGLQNQAKKGSKQAKQA